MELHLTIPNWALIIVYCWIGLAAINRGLEAYKNFLQMRINQKELKN